MKKYLEISKLFFKLQLAWRFDIAINVFLTIVKIVSAYLIWNNIFGTRELVSGFTFHTMLSYYIINSFLSQLDMSDRVSNEISFRIRGGTFSKYMVIPANIQGYFVSQTFGTSVFYLVFNLIAAIVWIFIFQIKFAITNNPFHIAAALLIALLGILFMIQLNYFLGLLTLKFEDIYLFLMIKNNILLFVTGVMIPLVLLPEKIVGAMKFLPFYYLTYLPSMLFIGRNEGEILLGFIVLPIWIVLFLLINKYTYERLRVRYDGVGI